MSGASRVPALQNFNTISLSEPVKQTLNGHNQTGATNSFAESLAARWWHAWLHAWPIWLIGAAWIWMFWPMMTGNSVCGFRDSAYLYYPLFQWTDAKWAAGEIPLWNPYCNYGMPVVGDGSSSVFYPGKLIFFCRFLSYPSRYGIYLAMHIPIAAAGTYWLAKTFRASKPGATLAAVGYAFGGSVLFQTTNVIFLVSAAWLPFAVCCVWKMVRTRKINWAIAGGVCCALIILGGDPQMTYHVGLIAAGTILLEAWRIRKRGLRRARRKLAVENLAWDFLYRGFILLTAMVVVTSLLAAVQIIPTYQWSKRSERTNPTQPANLIQAAMNLPIDGKTGFALIGEPDGTIDHAYQFSKEPWSMLELFWPNFSGKPFPVNQRWTNRFPGADRIWVPSVYMGVMVALFGVIGIRFWGRRRRNVWLSWLLFIFLIGSLGWYGPVWLYNEIFPQPPPRIGAEPISPLGPQVGGVYWLMQMFLPKYFAFRYPAKLFVIASLALSILAGINLRRIRGKHCAVVFSVFALISLVQFYSVGQIIPVDPGSLPKSVNSIDDAFFGPYDSIGCMRESTLSLVQVVLVMGLALASFVLVTRFFKQSSNRKTVAIVHVSFVLIALADVSIANRWMLAEVPASTFTTPLAIESKIDALKSKQTDEAPVWIFRNRYQPQPPVQWMQKQSDTRLEEIINWQRETLYPKHHLEHDVTLVGSFSSVWPIYYERELSLFETAKSHDLSNNTIRGAGLISGDGSQEHEPNVSIAPAIWLGSQQSERNEGETLVEVTLFSSNRVTVKLSPSTSGSLAFGRIAEPGWSATIRNLDDGTIDNRKLVLDRQQETLFLDFDSAGNYEVEFRYLPTGFVVGLIVSLISWAGLIVWWILVRWHSSSVAPVSNSRSPIG